MEPESLSGLPKDTKQASTRRRPNFGPSDPQPSVHSLIHFPAIGTTLQAPCGQHALGMLEIR